MKHMRFKLYQNKDKWCRQDFDESFSSVVPTAFSYQWTCNSGT